MNDVTRLLAAVEHGDLHASAQLLPLVYQELRMLAAQRLAREQPGQTLEATALVHEAYLRLVGAENDHRWEGRGHFFAAAAEAMRRILVEAARRKGRLRHGGAGKRVELNDVSMGFETPVDDLLDLDEAIDELATVDAAAAALVKLRYFAGLTTEQAAEALGVPVRTAYRTWSFARAWLFRRLRTGDEPPSG
jgi:RNA polymerase sigma factor (TIGR02999 family)